MSKVATRLVLVSMGQGDTRRLLACPWDSVSTSCDDIIYIAEATSLVFGNIDAVCDGVKVVMVRLSLFARIKLFPGSVIQTIGTFDAVEASTISQLPNS